MSTAVNSESVETVCLNCIFAGWNNTGNKQTGCSIGILQKYVNNGVELREYVNEEEVEFYGLPGRICMYNRTQHWLDKHQNTLPIDIPTVVRFEIKIPMTYILYVDEDATWDDIRNTVTSIHSHLQLPKELIFVFNKSNFRPSVVKQELNSFCVINWRAEFIADDMDHLKCLDLCIKKAKTVYVAFFEIGSWIPDDFIQSIDSFINDELGRFLLLTPIDDSLNGLVVQTHLARNIGGSREGKSLINKIKNVTEIQACPYLVRPVTEIVKSMSQ